MEGYLKSKSKTWVHAFKKSVSPGGKVPLDDLYKMYGEKYGLKEGEEFLTWLKDIKLKATLNKWEIILLDETPPEDVSKRVVEEEIEKTNLPEKRNLTVKEYTVQDIVLLSVRKAREVLPEIRDLKLLKYSLQEASQLANKDSLVRLLTRRIAELSISR